MMGYKKILQNIDWPTQILLIDFETYFDQEYSLSKLSTVEYVMDKRFEFTGCGFHLQLPSDDNHSYFITPVELEHYLWEQQEIYGKNLEQLTIIIQNAKFDALILQEKFGIKPPYIIDTLDLARHYDARMKHGLKDLAKLFELKAKGNTQQFKGLHYEKMGTIQKKALEIYCLADVSIEASLFKILLPLLSNPSVEIPLAKHTLELFLNPKVKLDFEKAEKLKIDMENELNQTLSKVSWVLDYV